MPFVRCRFYTEGGEPVRGGCHRKGAGCAFIHPDEPNWANARPASSKPRDKSGDSTSFDSWNGRGMRSAPAWATGANATSVTDTGSGWDTGGGCSTDSGWGGGWDTGGSASTPNQAAESTQPRNLSSATFWDASLSADAGNQADAVRGRTKDREDGWGTSTSASTGWGNSGNDGSGGSGWGDGKDAGKVAGPGTGSSGDDGWGASGWGDNKNADKDSGPAWGGAQDGGWGSGWVDDSDATGSWGDPAPMIVDNQAEKGSEQGKGKRTGKSVIAPPRIHIPERGDKKTRLSGMRNDDPVGSSKRGEIRHSSLATISTPVTTVTPVATLTPTDSTRMKRKRDANDATFDDKLDVFKEYIKTWERAVRTRFSLAEAETKRDRWFRTQKSACYARIGEAGRKRLDGQRAECDKEVSSQREKLSVAITSLVDFHDMISFDSDMAQRYNVGEEAEKFISESKAFVDEARSLLVTCILKDKDEAQPGSTQEHHSEGDATRIDSLQRQVQDLEARFEQAQTDLTLRYQRDIRPEIDELLAAKIQALRVARQHEIDRVASEPRPEIVVSPRALENMEGTARQVKEIETKIPRTVEDIRVLLLRVDAMNQRVDELEEEVSKNKETYQKVQVMATEKEETERRMNKQLQRIQEQFEQLVASQPLGPVTQTVVPPITHKMQDKMMESLRPVFESILDKFYDQEVRPTIKSLQQVVIEASDRHQEDAVKVLWGQMQPAMNVVSGVSRWLDSQVLGLTAPVEEDMLVADPS